jgi:c-di-GMP-related signal transduction protein
MYHTAQKSAESAFKMYEIKDYQLALVTFIMENVRWSTFLSTIRMVIVLVVKV